LASEVGANINNERFRGTPMEDYALSGAVLFLVGAIVRGYLWGTLKRESVDSNVELTAKINTTTSCSVDQFDSYCELMRP
jgi:hypothetical protein